MRSVLIADEPVIRSVDPSIKLVVEHQFEDPFGCREVERVAVDYREVRIYKHAAVESGDRALQIERLDQHSHPARRTAVTNGQRNTGVMQLLLLLLLLR